MMTNSTVSNEQLSSLIKNQEEKLLWAIRGMINPRRAAQQEAEAIEQLSILHELQQRRRADSQIVGYFAYDTDGGFTNHDTAERAQKEAQDAIEYFRETACDGWSDEVDSVCWGAIIQQAEQTDLRQRTEEDKCEPHIEEICDYVLLPEQKDNP